MKVSAARGARAAGFGGVVWVGLAAASASGHAPLGGLEVLLMLAPFAIVPLGLRLAASGSSLARRAMLLQPLAATLVLVSFWLPPGGGAAALACPWLVLCALVGLTGLAGLTRAGFHLSQESAASAGFIYLAVGAVWLVLSRLGATPMGFGEPIVLLTATHFHYAGFAAPLITAATVRMASEVSLRARAPFMIFGVIASPALVAAGFVISPWLKLLATLLLAVTLVLLSAIGFRLLRAVQSPLARVLLAASSACIAVGMTLAAIYAGGEAAGEPWIDIPQMVRLHGIANGPGFALCGLLAWNLIRSRDPAHPLL